MTATERPRQTLPFEQGCAIWALFHATVTARQATLRAREGEWRPGLNAEHGAWIDELTATYKRKGLTRISRVGLRRGLDELVQSGHALVNKGPRGRLYWRLTKTGRAYVGEPKL